MHSPWEDWSTFLAALSRCRRRWLRLNPVEQFGKVGLQTEPLTRQAIGMRNQQTTRNSICTLARPLQKGSAANFLRFRRRVRGKWFPPSNGRPLHAFGEGLFSHYCRYTFWLFPGTGRKGKPKVRLQA